jgi:hypothetical protein
MGRSSVTSAFLSVLGKSKKARNVPLSQRADVFTIMRLMGQGNVTVSQRYVLSPSNLHSSALRRCIRR